VGVVLLAIAWTLVLTVRHPAAGLALLVGDVVVAVGLAVTGIRYPSFATVYPAMAALQWGATRGVGGGVLAGAVVGAAMIVARLSTGLLPEATGVARMVRTAADTVNLVLAGGGLGFVATLLRQSANELRAAQAAEVRARERVARLTERESLGRQIHDSVLQVLALVHKRGRELAERGHVPGPQVAGLAELAAEQERTLRALILHPPDDAAGDNGTVSLRAALEAASAQVAADLDVEVTAVGDTKLPAPLVRELRAAVEQALHNVVEHAAADHAWIFVDNDDAQVVVTVRDDGRGFVYDERQLRDAGKYGLLRSIRGRVAELGGTTTIDTAPGRGTELELRVPDPIADGTRQEQP
jgi:signal transduction histidine kinase